MTKVILCSVYELGLRQARVMRACMVLAVTSVLLIGCSSTSIILPEDASEAVVVDRHVLYFSEAQGLPRDGGVRMAIYRRIDSPEKLKTLPEWMGHLERGTADYLSMSVHEVNSQNAADLDLVFDWGILDAGKLANGIGKPWSKPLDPSEAIALGRMHGSDIVISLDWVLYSSIGVGEMVNQPNVLSSSEKREKYPHRYGFALTNVECGFVAYDAISGMVLGRRVEVDPLPAMVPGLMSQQTLDHERIQDGVHRLKRMFSLALEKIITE